MKIRLTLFASLFFLFSITSKAQKSIVNRWLVAGKLSQGEAFPIGNPQEYEFLKDKTYKIYDDGAVSVNGNYEMGVDGNSFFLKNGDISLKVKIVKLNMLEMNIVYDMGKTVSDTMVYYVSGTPNAKIATKKFKFADEYFKNLTSLEKLYMTRGEIVTTISSAVKLKTKGNDSLINSIRQHLVKADKIVFNGAYVPKINVIQYNYIQENLDSKITQLLLLAEASNSVKSSKDYLDAKKKLSDNQKEIDKAKIKFNASFKSYYSA